MFAPVLSSCGQRRDIDLSGHYLVGGAIGGVEGFGDRLYQKRRDLFDKARRPVILSLSGNDCTGCRNSAGRTAAVVIRHALDVGAEEVEVTAEAEQAWVDLLLGNPRTFGGNPDCTPGYYNNEGQPGGRRATLNGSGYPEGPVAYFAYIDRWRSSGDFAGLELR